MLFYNELKQQNKKYALRPGPRHASSCPYRPSSPCVACTTHAESVFFSPGETAAKWRRRHQNPYPGI